MTNFMSATKIPYKYLERFSYGHNFGVKVYIFLSEYHPKFGVRAYVEARQPLHLTVAISEM